MVIILNVAESVMGIVVDCVSDVILLSSDQVKPAPRLGGQIDIDYLIGMGTIDGRMLLLVDIGKLISADDLGITEQLAA